VNTCQLNVTDVNVWDSAQSNVTSYRPVLQRQAAATWVYRNRWCTHAAAWTTDASTANVCSCTRCSRLCHTCDSDAVTTTVYWSVLHKHSNAFTHPWDTRKMPKPRQIYGTPPPLWKPLRIAAEIFLEVGCHTGYLINTVNHYYARLLASFKVNLHKPVPWMSFHCGSRCSRTWREVAVVTM